MLEDRVSAPRAPRVQYRVPACSHTRHTARIRARRRHAMHRATTSGRMMNDAVLVCIRKMSARAYVSGALRWHAKLHIIHYPTRTSSAYLRKPLLPLAFHWNRYTLASQS